MLQVIEEIEGSTKPKIVQWRTDKPAWKDQFHNGQWDTQLKDDDIDNKAEEIINSICGVKPKGKAPTLKATLTKPKGQVKGKKDEEKKTTPKKKQSRKKRVSQVFRSYH